MDYTVVGIDFGTSTTVVKIRNYYEAGTTPTDHTLQFDGRNLLPTLIFKDSEGNLSFGKEALIKEEADREKEGKLYENFKMKLTGDGSTEDKEAQELTQKFFKHIYSRFNEERVNLGVLPEVKTYVSYPVKWEDNTSRFLIECAKNAKFTNVEGIDEASAAIYAAIPNNLENLQKEGILNSDKPVNVMMLDMGAGTSDIAIFNFKIGADKKLAIGSPVTWPPKGKQNCGGSEIEGYLAVEFESYIKKISKKDEIKKNISKQIKGSVKEWKEDHLSLKLKDRGDVGLPGLLDDIVRDKQGDGIYENIQFERIDRQRFESITGEYWKQLRELIDGSLRNASEKLSGFTGAGDIDLIILTGGHSNWYGVSEFLKGEKFANCEPIDFTKIRNNPSARLLQEPSPQETVALGLVKMDEAKKKWLNLKPAQGNSVQGLPEYQDLAKCRERIAKYQKCIAAGDSFTVGLKADGTVVAVGYNKHGQCDTGSWRDIVAIATGCEHTIGLRADSKVVVVGNTKWGLGNIMSWRDIVAIAAGIHFTVGLKADGTVVAVNKTGYGYGQCDTDNWQNIIAVFAGNFITIGKKSDGTVIAIGSNISGQCNIGNWRDIVAIAVGSSHTVGLKADGTVITVGNNYYGQCDTGSWRDIVAVAACNDYTVGLKADGTVVAVGRNKEGQCDTGSWQDIVAIAAGSYHTVGLKADGTVVAVGDNKHCQCATESWNYIGPASDLKV